MLIIIISLISINFLIIAHELGHFLLAKFYNVKIDEFSIGFPPRIFSFKRGEVLYSINAIPFGAFVKLNEDLAKDDQRNFANKKTHQKAIIFLGGVLTNIIIAFIIFLILFNIGFPKVFLPAGYNLRYSFGQAFIVTFRFMADILVQSLIGLKTAFVKIFTRLDVSDLMGPVGLFALTSRGFRYGLSYGVGIIGIISYALAIFNLLPIPAVDGGQILFLLIGKIRRKPISRKTEELITNIVFGFLILLAVLVTIKDVRFFYFH